MTNTRNSHAWSVDNLYTAIETHFQKSLSGIILCRVIERQDKRVISTRTTRELLLQKDGSTRHFGRQVTAFLNESFQNRYIGRQCQYAWPPRSPNLSSLN
jgi:hypothetical protein